MAECLRRPRRPLECDVFHSGVRSSVPSGSFNDKGVYECGEFRVWHWAGRRGFGACKALRRLTGASAGQSGK